MVSALIGELPAGWTETNLAEICELTAGAALQESPDGRTTVIKPKNLVGGRITGTFDHVSDEESGRLARYQLKPGDIACVRTGAIGRHASATSEHEGSVFGTGIIRIRPSGDVDARYLDSYLSHPAVLDWLERNAVRSPIPNVSTGVLGTLPVALAPFEVQRSIGRTLHVLNEKVAAHERIARTTAALRDATIPLLFSGTVTIAAEEESPLR
ncbi:restriction endonuclease subunit S [Nonomuraea sp. NPDC051191]|uniref:restriction endonuclease subunit S n=1 Tax=Nonomuraea sp. NPDC051191 TaxID=3364372 RepID=UPI00378A76E6